MGASKYPKGILPFLQEHAAGKTTFELADMINAEFGEGTITRNGVRAYKKRHKIKSGIDTTFKKGHETFNKGLTWEEYGTKEGHERSRRTTFQKGHKAHNYQEVGSHSVTSDGYHITKVKEEGIQRERWQFTHRLIWEKAHGPVPEGKMVEFADGDKNNLDLDNLILTDKREHLELVRSKTPRVNAELTKTQLALVKLEIATRKAKKAVKASRKK